MNGFFQVLESLWSDTLTAWTVVVFLLVIAGTFGWMVSNYWRLRRLVNETVEGHLLWTAAVANRVVVDDDDDGEEVWVLREPAQTIASRFVTAELAKLESFRMGPRFTGFALVITFVLIAIVLVTHVSHAIAPNAPPDELPKAVTLLGAKFSISALGVLASIGHQWLAEWLRMKLLRRARATLAEPFFRLEVIDSWQFKVATRQREATKLAHEELVAELRSVRQTIATGTEHATKAVVAASESLRAEVSAGRQDATNSGEALRVEVIASGKNTTTALGRLESTATTRHEWLVAMANGAASAFTASSDAINLRLEKLGNLEVSVRDIGKEVAENLGNVMRSSIGEQMCSKLEELADRVDRAAEHVEENLRAAVGTMMTEEVAHIRVALDALRTAVEQQGGSQVEVLLEQLRNAVSGGFQSESQGMAEALQSFAQVVPQLESQVRGLVEGLSSDMSERTSRGAELADRMLVQVANIMPRMEGLLGALEQQQSSVNSSVAQISAASSAGARRMVEEITSAADVRIVQMTERAAADLTTTFSELREATALATAAHADVQRAGAQAQGVAVALVREAERMMGDANSMRRDAVTQAQNARLLVDEVRAMSEALREAAREVSRQTALVTTTIAEQTALQVRQQKTLEQLESTMPKLFETYGTSIQKQAETLALSWEKQAASVRQVMDGVGGDFASGVQDLSDAVDRLEKSLGQKRLST